MPSLTVALLLLEWLHDGVYAGRCVCGRAREHQTPTCTPIILDGLAVKCVMWGSVSVRAQTLITYTPVHYLH